MDGPPRKPADGVIDRNMVVHVLLAGVIMAATTLLAIDLWLPGGLVEGSADLAEARTAGFTVLVLAQLFNCLNSRSERNTAFRGVMSAPFLLVAIATSVILQIVVTGVPAFNQAFGTSPLSGAEWALCTAMASSVLWIIELKKLILRRSASSRRSVGRAPLA